METKQQLQEIIDNAPEGAQFFDIIIGIPLYVKINVDGDFFTTLLTIPDGQRSKKVLLILLSSFDHYQTLKPKLN